MYQKVTSGHKETVAYVFTDIPFLEKEKALKMITKYGRTDAKSWP